jgi:hypothetical protein
MKDKKMRTIYSLKKLTDLEAEFLSDLELLGFESEGEKIKALEDLDKLAECDQGATAFNAQILHATLEYTRIVEKYARERNEKIF